MRRMKGQEAVFYGGRIGLTIGLLNFIGPVAASTSKCCQIFQSLLVRKGSRGGWYSAQEGILTVVVHELIQRELLDLLLLGSWTSKTLARVGSEWRK